MKIAVALFLILFNGFAFAEILFTDNFEGNLNRWQISRKGDVLLRNSQDPKHGTVMELIPNGDTHALIRGSEHWKGVRIRGEVLFPENVHNYLGVIYNYHSNNGRIDFGNIYIKGNGSYLQPNPHWDFNVGRALYPEYEIRLTGTNAVKIGEWQRFQVEVIDTKCHFYFVDMKTPQITFTIPPLKTGGFFGLKPRSVGGEVWVDNIQVESITAFGYTGPPRPQIVYHKDKLLTRWEVLGPLDRYNDEIARNSNATDNVWKPFPTDARGAVITSLITDHCGPDTVAYFRTVLNSEKDEQAFLDFSSIDNLALWVNGQFRSFIYHADHAWFDFLENPEHVSQRIPISLKKGKNEIILRARGGVYATGGFCVALE